MKRSLSADKSKKGGVKWNEANLEENEVIKAELAPTKILEPKTPYHRPMGPDEDDILDDDTGMATLDLEHEEHHSRSSTPGLEHENGAMSPCEERHDGSEGATAHPSGDLRHASWERSPEPSSSGDEDAREEKRRRFAEKRRSHYQMKEALSRSKALISGDGEKALDSGNPSTQDKP